jgi:hypothetical protein
LRSATNEIESPGAAFQGTRRRGPSDMVIPLDSIEPTVIVDRVLDHYVYTSSSPNTCADHVPQIHHLWIELAHPPRTTLSGPEDFKDIATPWIA